LPAIAERLSVLHQSLARDVNEWGVQPKERLDNIESRLGDLFEGHVSMTLSSTRRVAVPAGCSTPVSITMVTSFHSLPTSPPNPASRSPRPTAGPVGAVRALPHDLDHPAAVKEVDSGFGDGPSAKDVYLLRRIGGKVELARGLRHETSLK
jgi:hypothetical protein